MRSIKSERLAIYLIETKILIVSEMAAGLPLGRMGEKGLKDSLESARKNVRQGNLKVTPD